MTPPLWLGQTWLAPKYLGALFSGLLLTAWLAFLVCLLATLLGVVLTAMTESRYLGLRSAARFFISVHRNTPLMVQVLLWYFGVPNLLPEEAMLWLNTPHTLALPLGLEPAWPSYEFLSAWISLSLYSASFIAGELASGLRAVSHGQREAARALGLRPWQELRHVILPQALAYVRQPLIGQYTGAIKNTSLTMAIGVAELSYRSRQVESETLLTFQAFAVATALYLLLILASQWFGHSQKPIWGASR
ncbi:MAG: amino acid transporter permease [Proteobacteria bacterium]|nr:amino acid transporter permease [Pseudomonadota bacterium]